MGHTCIYCKSQKNSFNREHVIPEAFGTFESNWCLLNCVCCSCNAEFGKTIEPVLSRDSPEALLRLEYGIKSPSKARELHYNRFTLRVNEPGVWFGARFVFVSDAIGQKMIPHPLPQVALRMRMTDQEWSWFLEDELANPKAVERFRLGQPGEVEIKIVSPTQESTERLIAKLQELGIRFNKGEGISEPLGVDGKLNAEVGSVMDTATFRAIAKIIFNYVTYLHGAGFVLLPDFDDLRNYIRYGNLPKWSPIVRPSVDPILADDSRSYQQTHGHLMTFDWDSANVGLFGQVSLFNSVTYRITFCPFYSGVWRGDLCTGHLFDIESRQISRLRTIRRPF